MPTTVGQHAVATFTSPVNGTTPIDANTVRGNDNTIRTSYVAHDADPGIHVQSSTLASRPAAGTAGRKWMTVDAGSYKLWYDDGTRWHAEGGDSIALEVIADATLVKGDVVMVTGFNNGQNVPTVNKFNGTAPAFGIANEAIASGARGYIINTGIISDIKTDTFGATGTVLYPAATGTFTSTKPTSGTYQPAAYVLRSNPNNGVLYVEFSASRIVETSSNTANTVVLRDGSGNFSAGTITAGALTSTGLVTFASLKGTGAITVTNILDEDNMASDSATALATQQSIKAYVDSKVATVDTLAEVLANGNTTGANNIIVSSGQQITTNTIAETTAGSGVTIDSVLLKDDVVNATDIETGTLSANDGTTAATIANATGKLTISAAPTLSALTASQAVFTDGSKNLVSNAITGTGNVVMSDSPTLTGTATAATLNATTLGGTLSTAAQPNVTSVGTLSSLAVSGNLTVDTNTLFVDATNNRVGVGTASPAVTLNVGHNAHGIGISYEGSGTLPALAGIYTTGSGWGGGFGDLVVKARTDFGASYDILFVTATTANVPVERARIDASGNLGIGVTPTARLHVKNASGGVTPSNYVIVEGSTADNGNYPGIELKGGTLVTTYPQITLTNGGLGLVLAKGYATGYPERAEIALNNPGIISFSTSTTGTTTERARITAGGYFKASNNGTYLNATGAYHEVNTDIASTCFIARTTGAVPNAAGDYGVLVLLSNVATVGTAATSLSCADQNATRFSVTTNGNVYNVNGTYGTLSDAKLKQDITDAGSQWDDIKAIRFRKYRLKLDVDAQGDAAPYLLGVVAQELQAVSPGLVDARPDTEQVEVEVEVEKSRPVLDEDGQPVLGEDGEPLTEAYTETETRTETRPTGTETLSVKQSILLMKAAVALQEAMARIETLEARLAALEAK